MPVNILLPMSCFHLFTKSGCEPVVLLGMRVEALSNQEEKTAANQKVKEMGNQLAALTTFGRALCDLVLGVGRGDARLALRFDEAR